MNYSFAIEFHLIAWEYENNRLSKSEYKMARSGILHITILCVLIVISCQRGTKQSHEVMFKTLIEKIAGISRKKSKLNSFFAHFYSVCHKMLDVHIGSGVLW